MKPRQTFLQKIAPDGIDIAYGAFGALLLLFLGNLGRILDAYNVPGSRQILQSEIGRNITNFLAKIDDFSFTKTAVLFLFWSFVGLIVYSVVQAFVSANSSFQYEREVSSGNYVHPESFDKNAYLKHVLHERFVKFCLALVFWTVFVCATAFVFPYASDQFGALIEEINSRHILLAVLGLILLSASLVLLIVLSKAVRHRGFLTN